MIAFTEPPKEAPRSPALRRAHRLLASTLLPPKRGGTGWRIRRAVAWMVGLSLVALAAWGVYLLVVAAVC